jgi:hypothetical protein
VSDTRPQPGIAQIGWAEIATMKFAVGIIVFVWLLAGLIGAWMLDELNTDHWKAIARGPITLGKAVDEHPGGLTP